MKLNFNRKKLRYGSVSVALTAFIIATVVLLNVLFSSLATNNRWYIDMTSEMLFTLTDECRDLINNAIVGEGGVNDQRQEYNQTHGLSKGDADYKDEVEVNIYFCDDPDNLTQNYYMNFVYTTALDLAEKCEFINIDYLNWEYNPTSVQKYQKTGVNINSNSVIIESGEEYRVHALESFYILNDEDVAWAYNGEKEFAGSILAVTSVDQPVAYITTSHSEQYYDTALLELLLDAGYKVQFEGQKDKDGNVTVESLNAKTNPLENEDIRLVVIYNPRSDFQTDGVDELDRLDRFLEDNNSMMVFMGPTSPVLPNFEEWLATWGVVFDRYTDDAGKVYNYMINDKTSSLDSAGYAIKANYVTGGGGASIYSQLVKNGYTPPVIFDNAMSISFATNFELTTQMDDEDKSKDFSYGYYYGGGVSKYIYDVFTAPSSSVAIANGTTVAEGATQNPTGENLDIVYRDSKGNIYRLNADKTKIVDEDGAELPYNANGNFEAKDGTELTIKDGAINAIGNVGSFTAIVKEIIEYDGTKYTLSDDGKSILDSKGNALSANEDGRFVTEAGSILEIETIGKEASIKIVAGAQTSVNPFRFMTFTRRSDSVQETNWLSTNLNSLVLACGSLEFATEKYLNSAVYANADVLLSATTLMGRDTVPIGLDFKPFSSFDISDITDAEANRYTILLATLPAAIVIGVGIVVLVRRKYS